jgi:short-subunit dehydrogenase
VPETIIVTGASSGIGRALAVELAAPGKTLHLYGLNEERLRDVAAEVRHHGASCTEIALDLTRFEECETHFAETFPPGTTIDALYHCVGRATFGELQHTSPEDLAWVHHTNLLTTAQWISLVYPRMTAQGSGRIVLLSSLSGYTDLPMCASYAGTKRALLALSHGMCPEARSHNVNLTVVFPGFIESRIFDAGRYHELSPAKWKAGVDSLRIPFLSAEKAARAIVRGARRGKARLVFPFYARLLAFLSFRFPVVNGIVHRFFLHQLRS